MKQLVNSNITPDWPNIEVNFHKPIELFIDSLCTDFTKNSLKILWVKEAEEISRFRDIAIQNHTKYDIVLTYDEEILRQCKNSHFMPFGSTWVHDFDLSFKKRFEVSHLIGPKNYTYGHKLRHFIFNKQNDIKVPKNFFVSHHMMLKENIGYPILTDSKNPLFESQFSICIENSNQKNLFTEKLIDCFITKTVPIFWGCKNIGDFFNMNGMLIINNEHEAVNVCNSLNKESYNNMTDAIEDNYQRCLKFANLAENFKHTLQKVIN